MTFFHSRSWFLLSATWWISRWPFTSPWRASWEMLPSPSGSHSVVTAVPIYRFSHSPMCREVSLQGITPRCVVSPLWCARSLRQPIPPQYSLVTQWDFPLPAWCRLWWLCWFLWQSPLLYSVSLNQFYVGCVRYQLQPVHTFIGQVHREGVEFLIHGLVSETIQHLENFDDIRTVIHGFPGRKSF